MTDREKILRPGPGADRDRHPGQMPPCPECGGKLGFAGAGGGQIHWWRCVDCRRMYPSLPIYVCAHVAPAAARCAVCGRSPVGVTVNFHEPTHEITMHFCSIACARSTLKE